MSNNTTFAYTVDVEKAKLHFTDGNDKIGKDFTITYSTIPGAGFPTWKNGKQIVDVMGTCAGVCGACSKDCYAAKILKRRSNSCAIPWAENTVIVRTRPERLYIDLTKKIRNRRRPLKYVRFHVAGEFESGAAGMSELLQLRDLANDNPGVIFYGYTKRSALLADYEQRFGAFPGNLVIMCSMWRNALGVESVKNYTNAPEFIYDDGTHDDIAALTHCPAVDRNGHETGITCEQCGHCQHARKGDKIAVYAH